VCPSSIEDLYEPPETATPELDDWLTEVEVDWTPMLVELAAVEAFVDVGEAVETPGIVLALTTPSRPTPATAANATAAVSRLSSCKAEFRACTLVTASFVLSMTLSIDRAP
jgi:hypothetical protein